MLNVPRILNQAGEALLHRNIRANLDAFLKAVAPYLEDLVVAVESVHLVAGDRDKSEGRRMFGPA